MPVSKSISYVFYCFMNFLCISLFFRPFVFLFFLRKNHLRTIFKHKYAKINWFQPMKVKIIISLWIRWENSICIDFVHKITFLSHFRSDGYFWKSCSVVTVRPIFAKMVSKDARDLKVKSQQAARSENFVRRSGRGKCRGGGHDGPPPVWLGLRILLTRYMPQELTEQSHILPWELDLVSQL